MKYRIGEVADFFGLTKEAIRYYERKGIVHSTRDERTGYRYYERDEITTLKQIRTFESLGFSLPEAQAMIVETTFPEMEERLAEKLRELKKKEEALIRMQKEIEYQQKHVQGFKSEKIELRVMPETYFWKRVPDEASVCTDREREEIAKARNEEKRWAEAMPPVKLCGLHYDKNLNPQSVFGSTVECETARELGLPLSRAVVLPKRLCAVGYAQAKLGDKPDISHLAAWVTEHEYRICGDIYAALRIVYRKKDGERWGVHEFFLPIELCE